MRLAAQDRRQLLLDTAAELFSRQGYEGTTTRQIAADAGVTEALIFRHFPRKEDLYWQVIEARCRTRGAQEQLRTRLDSGDPDEKVFTDIACDILRRHTEDPQLYRLLLFSALEKHELSQRFFRTHISEYYEKLAVRIRERTRSGEFCQIEPMLAARGFVGMLMHYFLMQELFGGKHYQHFHYQKVAEELTRIWLAGMRKNNTKNGRNPLQTSAASADHHVVRTSKTFARQKAART